MIFNISKRSYGHFQKKISLILINIFFWHVSDDSKEKMKKILWKKKFYKNFIFIFLRMFWTKEIVIKIRAKKIDFVENFSQFLFEFGRLIPLTPHVFVGGSSTPSTKGTASTHQWICLQVLDASGLKLKSTGSRVLAILVWKCKKFVGRSRSGYFSLSIKYYNSWTLMLCIYMRM